MDRERWERIRELFRVALDLPGNDRAAWLHGGCVDQEERREVESLLAIHRNASGFLEQPACGWQPPEPGTWLAERYQLRDEIGRGGMSRIGGDGRY